MEAWASATCVGILRLTGRGSRRCLTPAIPGIEFDRGDEGGILSEPREAIARNDPADVENSPSQWRHNAALSYWAPREATYVGSRPKGLMYALADALGCLVKS